MSAKINLLFRKSQKKTFAKIKKFLFSGAGFILINLVIFGSSLYAYFRILNRQKQILEEAVEIYTRQTASFKEIEEKKSLVNIKLNELAAIYNSRVDFVKALDDLKKIFAGRMSVSSMTLNQNGEVKIETKEKGALGFDPSQKFPKEISLLELQFMASSSAELEDFLNHLKSLSSQSLVQATLISLKREKEGGYEFALRLKMEKKPL